jgi:hypothetical protein
VPRIASTALTSRVASCARLGVIHSQVFGGFSGAACGHRIADSGCRILTITTHHARLRRQTRTAEGRTSNPIRVLVAGAIFFAAGYAVFAAGPHQPASWLSGSSSPGWESAAARPPSPPPSPPWSPPACAAPRSGCSPPPRPPRTSPPAPSPESSGPPSPRPPRSSPGRRHDHRYPPDSGQQADPRITTGR